MATSNAQRFLAKNGADDEIALEMYFGTVLQAFSNKTPLWNAVNGDYGVGSMAAPSEVVASRTIDSGKSWQFPIFSIDVEGGEYHTEGTELLGQSFEVDESNITIDDILVSHRDIAASHIQMSHFDVMSKVATKNGHELAIRFNSNLMRTGVKAANSGVLTKNGVTIHNGGNAVTTTAASLTAAYAFTQAGAFSLRDDLANLAQKMDEDDVPEDARFLLLTPHARRVLSHDQSIFNSDLSRELSNSLNRRIIGEVEGFAVLGFTNQMPDTNVTTGPAAYQGDFTVGGSGNGQPIALALCGAPEGDAAIGYVAANMSELGPIYATTFFDERRNTQFVKAQMMVGAGILAPYCAGVVQVKSS